MRDLERLRIAKIRNVQTCLVSMIESKTDTNRRKSMSIYAMNKFDNILEKSQKPMQVTSTFIGNVFLYHSAF